MLKHMPHDWQTAPPGTGSLKVCSKCGQRQRPEVEASECQGAYAAPEAGIVHEYDPFN